MGIPPSDKLQSLRFSLRKEHKLEKEAGSKFMALELFGDIHDEKCDNQDFDDCPLHPDNDTIFRFFKRPKEDGSYLIAVLSAKNSDNAVIFPNSSGNSSIFKQPDKLRVSRDFKLEMLRGRFLKFSHPSKFNETSLSIYPTDS